MNYTEVEKTELLDEVFDPDTKKLEDFKRIQAKLGQITHNTPEVEPESEQHPQTEEEEIEEVKNNLLALSKHNAMAGKVFLQLKGLLVERQEHKVEFELSAEEHIKIGREAQRRLREGSSGTDGSPVLLGEPKGLPE